jgi:hypothetical protein
LPIVEFVRDLGRISRYKRVVEVNEGVYTAPAQSFEVDIEKLVVEVSDARWWSAIAIMIVIAQFDRRGAHGGKLRFDSQPVVLSQAPTTAPWKRALVPLPSSSQIVSPADRPDVGWDLSGFRPCRR